MLIHMQMLFSNVPSAQIKVILVLMRLYILTIMKQIWTQMNGYFLYMNSSNNTTVKLFSKSDLFPDFEGRCRF